MQHGRLVLHEEALCPGTDEMQGGDGPHEGPNVRQPILVGSLLGRGEATCGTHITHINKRLGVGLGAMIAAC